MFLPVPISVGRPEGRPPIITYWLLFLCGLGSVLPLPFGQDAFFSDWGFVPSKFQAHTLLTSLFLHSGILHLIGNALYLFLLGGCLEDLLGRARFLLLYASGGITAALTHAGLDPAAAGVPLVGASGAISACLGACAVLLPRTEVEFRLIYVTAFRFGSRTVQLPLWLLGALWLGGDLLGIVRNGPRDVAFWAHIGGLLFGAAVSAPFRKRLRPGASDSPGSAQPTQPTVDAYVDPVGGQPREPFTVNLHRACGLVVGVGLGLGFVLLATNANSGPAFLFWGILGGALGSIAAGRGLDRFWSALMDWFRGA